MTVESHHGDAEFLPPIFVTPKSDEDFWLLLNLKMFDKTTDYKKFKTETISTILCFR